MEISSNQTNQAMPKGEQKFQTLYARLLSLVILSICLSILGTAVWLDADPSGVGTHQQLGLPPCGFYAATQLPCATCGMTTSFTYAAHGHLVQSFITQPAGMLLCLGLSIMTILSGYTLIVGISLLPILQRLCQPRCFLFLGLLISMAWVYKITRVYLGY